MVGRRYYRIKVLQALYAWFQGGEHRMEVAEKNLLQGIDKFNELYFLLFSLFSEIIDFYRRRTEDAKHKFLPTDEELNPNFKFLENRVVFCILQNKDLIHQVNRYKFSWTEDQEMIRKVFLKLRNSKEMKDYLNSGIHSFKEDQEIVYKLFRKFITRSADLQSYCEERCIHWNDDFQLAALFIQKTIQLIPEDFSEDIVFTNLFDKEEEDDPSDDQQFVLDLFGKSIFHSEEFEHMIEGKTKNWELERIALVDIILIKMALTELIYFPTIPVKVTLNEYIDISKNYSTPKSKLFINGILDKLVETLTSDKKITKLGRGLLT
jgi:transcription antitermination protein NusB